MAEMLLEQMLAEAERTEHNAQIADNYRRLMEATIQSDETPTLSPAYTEVLENAISASETAEIEAPAVEEPAAPAAQEAFDAAVAETARIADFAAAPVGVTSGGYEGYVSYVVAPAATAGDEAAPTPRTMDTILRPTASEATEEQARVGFLSALSTRMKAVLLTVALAIVVAIALVIVNTAIINSIDANITNKQIELDRVIREANKIENKIRDATDPDQIDAWAQENGMVFGQG